MPNPQSNKQANKVNSRRWITIGISVLTIVLLVLAFLPKPIQVDMAIATIQPMRTTISEEGRTRVHDKYVVSSPIRGRLARVELEPGDKVVAHETVIARMMPAAPASLDDRTLEQVKAELVAAQAQHEVAQAEHTKALADKSLAKTNLKRAKSLIEVQAIAAIELEQAQNAYDNASAIVDIQHSNIAMRSAEIARVQASMMQFNPQASEDNVQGVAIYSPISGVLLQREQESETTLLAGTPIAEVGDIEHDLEVLVELLSNDAIKIAPNNSVVITNWGGAKPLKGTVRHIEPRGFTKFSALGVEEQRVNTYVSISSPFDERTQLGHGYRVEVEVVTWQNDQALTVPSSALFRTDGNWTLFKVVDGTAEITQVEVAQNNGQLAYITSGIKPNDQVISYPEQAIQNGSSVEQR